MNKLSWFLRECESITVADKVFLLFRDIVNNSPNAIPLPFWMKLSDQQNHVRGYSLPMTKTYQNMKPAICLVQSPHRHVCKDIFRCIVMTEFASVRLCTPIYDYQ